MPGYDDVARIVAQLPGAAVGERHGNQAWSVGDKTFAWERPFSKADIKRYGTEEPPTGPILAVATADLDEKEAALAAHPDSFFTISHFDGYKAILVRLEVADLGALEEALLDGWLTVAPVDAARAHLESLGLTDES